MKLKDLLIETEKESSIDDLVKLLKTECSDFLNELDGNFFIRGTEDYRNRILSVDHDDSIHYIYKEFTFENRQPRDTDEKVHEKLDLYFLKNHGFKARSHNIMFALGDNIKSRNIIRTYEYGAPYLVFPVGKYKYVWSPKVEDLTNEITSHTSKFIENAESFMNRLEYVSRNLSDASTVSNEVMFQCKEHILVPMSLRDELKKELF